MDLAAMESKLAKVRAKVFYAKTDAAFLGSLLCKIPITLSEEVPTAATDGKTILFNPKYLDKLPIDTGVSILVHELWHIVRQHHSRCGNRDFGKWNTATDIAINNSMIADGYTFTGASPLVDNKFKVGTPEETIYDALPNKEYPEMDMVKSVLSEEDNVEVVKAIVSAYTAQKQLRQGNNSALFKDCETALVTLLEPKVSWQTILQGQLSSVLGGTSVDWSRRNRRYRDVYLPSHKDISYPEIKIYVDTSGSVSNHMADMLLTEVQSIIDLVNKSVEVIYFDTAIRYKESVTDSPPEIFGRGGTDMRCVVKDLKDTPEDTLVIIMSDFDCDTRLDFPSNLGYVYLRINSGYAVPNVDGILIDLTL